MHDLPSTIHDSPMQPANLALYACLFAAFAFVLGACIGSFLNVCIYRMPLGLSVNEPKRSFCPHCKKPIPWHHNLPLISWLWLRGKCAKCGAPIAFRYFGVELLTAVLFLAVWWRVWIHPRPEWLGHGWVLALPYWIFVSLLVVATFIDFEHFIIPDEITVGGTIAGVALSFAIPALMAADSHWMGGLLSLGAAALGFAILWAVVELGKKAFGKKRIVLDKSEPFTWTRDGDDADFKVGEEVTRWSEIFSRETDQLLVECGEAEVAGKRYENVTLKFFYNRLLVAGDEYTLEKLDTITGVVSEITIPREAMGFGDVKFIAAIGAFLGWKAVLFTIMSASVIGAVIGVIAIVAGRREWSAKIPFGPYLALGSLLWMFAGPELVRWYFSLMAPAGI
jgi:leader peptidase (prepilin peptidase) / N-methyltransferase